MILTILDGTATAVFSDTLVTSSVIKAGITISLDESNTAVSATFKSHGAAIILCQILSNYNMILSDHDKTTLLSSRL